jgi:hypothetical protein
MWHVAISPILLLSVLLELLNQGFGGEDKLNKPNTPNNSYVLA